MARRMIDDTAREAVNKIAYNKESNKLEVGSKLYTDGTLEIAYQGGRAIQLDGADIDDDGQIASSASAYTLVISDSDDPHIFEFKDDGIYLDGTKITN